jgi:hypothetical protein
MIDGRQAMENGKSYGLVALIASPIALTVALPLLLLLGMGGGVSAIPAPPGGALDPGAVPSAYLTYVLTAGAKCPQVTAPAIAAQLEAESGWRSDALSPAGAQGIAQFMPGTWATWGKDVNNDGSASAFDPADAIGAQGDFLCALAAQMAQDVALGIVKGDILDLSFAAYNAGPGAVEQYHGIPPFPETQSYVAAIRALMLKYTLPGGTPLPGGQNAIVDAASQWLGYPYVYGGGGIGGPSGIGRDGRGPGFDCSGLVQNAVYRGAGITLARTADAQIRDSRGTAIPRDWAQMKAGDIIGFSEDGSGLPGSFGHIGIYLGGGKMLHAPKTGEDVSIYDLTQDTYFAPMAWRILRFTP